MAKKTKSAEAAEPETSSEKKVKKKTSFKYVGWRACSDTKLR